MAAKYRIVEEGRSVYVQVGLPFLFFTIWHWDKHFALYSGKCRKDYNTVAAARAAIDWRVADDAKWIDPPRVTEYPGPECANSEATRQQELEAARRRCHDYGPRY